MNKELEAALAASRARRAERVIAVVGKGVVATIPSGRKRRVSAPKTEEQIEVAPKTEAVIEYPKRVILPTWKCKCPRKHDITPSTVLIKCYRCNTEHEVRKSKFDKEDA